MSKFHQRYLLLPWVLSSCTSPSQDDFYYNTTTALDVMHKSLYIVVSSHEGRYSSSATRIQQLVKYSSMKIP